MSIFVIIPNIEVSFPTFLSLCHTPSLFLNELKKNQVLNKTVYSVMKNFNVTLMFSVYNKYEEGKKSE
jgi:hypothetical protein